MGTRKNLANAQARNSQLFGQLDIATAALNKELQLTDGVKSQLSHRNEQNTISLTNLIQRQALIPAPKILEVNGSSAIGPPLIFIGIAVASFFLLRGKLL